MKEHLQKTYDRIAPNAETRHRMLQTIQRETRTQKIQERPLLKPFLTVAVCVTLVLLLSVFGIAAYQKWSLPEPVAYTVDPDSGVYQVRESQTYTAPVTTVPSVTATSTGKDVQTTTTTAQSTMSAALTDEDFILRAMDILHLVGLTDVQSEQLTVVRQKELYWNRNEVEVRFTEDENNTSVSFYEASGELLGITSIDWAIDGAAVCHSYAEAAELATRYYKALPVPQGYVLTGCDQYDAQYWSFLFCREVQEGVYSWYEAAKIAVNPQTGRLTGCHLFYVPLLDDHEAGDVPLTAEEAEKIARSCAYVHLDKYQLESCELAVVLPNWMFTDKTEGGINAQSCDVSRLGWTLKFNNPNSEFADIITLYVDYYTGEILGGDMT